jgi:hypothetical protein
MDIGAVLKEGSSIYFKHWFRLVTMGLVVFAVTALGTAAVINIGLFTGLIFAIIISTVGGLLLQGALIKVIEDVRDGRVDMTVGEAFSKALPFLGKIFVASLIAGVAVAVGLFLLILPGLILLTIWAFIAPVIVLEGASTLGSFTRSRELVRGNGGAVFGLIVLTFLLGVLPLILLDLLMGDADPAIRRFVSDLAGGALLGPFTSCMLITAYFHLRGEHPRSESHQI